MKDQATQALTKIPLDSPGRLRPYLISKDQHFS